MLFQLLVEVGLQLGRLGVALLLHEGGDLRIGEPGFPLHLIAADVEVGVGEDAGPSRPPGC